MGRAERKGCMKQEEYSDILNSLPYKMYLQHFAGGRGDSSGGNDEGDSGGDSGDGSSGGDGGNNGGDDGGMEEDASFDGLLQSGHQAEFDRRVQQAVSAALTNQKGEYEELMDNKLSEAEKLAKMTKDEKKEYLQQKREQEITERETALARKELAAEAKNELAARGLPASLSDVLQYADADSCKASIEAVEKAFKEAVEKAVEERLKGGKPLKRTPGNNAGDSSDEAVNFAKGIAKAVQTEASNKAQDYYFN